MAIGRTVIAVLMGRAIVMAKRRRNMPPDTDLLGYIFDRMSEGARHGNEFAHGNSGVRFVTFNFDFTICSAVGAITRRSLYHGQAERRRPSCGTLRGQAPQVGDTLVIAKATGRADVRRLADNGMWAHVWDDISDLDTAHSIARTALELRGHTVWYREEFERDSAIRPYNQK